MSNNKKWSLTVLVPTTELPHQSIMHPASCLQVPLLLNQQFPLLSTTFQKTFILNTQQRNIQVLGLSSWLLLKAKLVSHCLMADTLTCPQSKGFCLGSQESHFDFKEEDHWVKLSPLERTRRSSDEEAGEERIWGWNQLVGVT